MRAPVYLDHLATTPIDPRVLDAMLPYLRERFGHPGSRSHAYGWEAEQAVEAARARVADLVGADPKEVVFTSGGTEADTLAVQGVVAAAGARGRHVVTTVVEQRSVRDTVRALVGRGRAEATEVACDAAGRVAAEAVEAAIRPDTVLVCCQAANAEVGTRQPVAEVGARCLARGVPLHVDARHALGHVALDLRRDGAATLSLAAHLLGGPKGAGALVARRKDPRVRVEPLLLGGGQERGLRAGTPDVAALVGFGVAAELVRRERDAEAARVAALRDRLEGAVLARVSGVARHGDVGRRLPGATSLAFEGVEAEALLMGMPDVAAATGAGCASASLEPSYVLRAMGVPDADANRTVRFSLGRTTTEEDVDLVVARVAATVERLRAMATPR